MESTNNLTSNNLKIGQILNIPITENNTYTVKPGDTLYRIATQNNTTVDALKQLNNLDSNNLIIGQILKLPSTETIKVIKPPLTYTVKSGDTLYSIAKSYNTTIDQLKQLNDLNTNILKINQKLKVPNNTYIEIPTTTKVHTVKPGDTLYSIARTYSTTVDNIKKLNNLSNNILSVGQEILISP